MFLFDMNKESQIITISLIVVAIGTIFYFMSASSRKHSKHDPVDISKSLRNQEKDSLNAQPVHPDKVLSPSQFRKFKVLKVTRLSPNTKLIRFELPPGKNLGLHIGRHITLRAEIDGLKVMRSYTPTSRIDQTGYFDLVIKSYEFGKMSSYLCNLHSGSEVEIRGPVGKFHYKINSYKKIGLIAGGTGITPCLQLLSSILLCPDFQDDTTQFVLFYQNRTEDDILLLDTLQAFEKQFPGRLQIFYFLSNSTTEEFGSKLNEKSGYINRSLIHEYMGPEECQLICLCGPSGFNECMNNHLVHEGHHEGSIFIW